MTNVTHEQALLLRRISRFQLGRRDTGDIKYRLFPYFEPVSATDVEQLDADSLIEWRTTLLPHISKVAVLTPDGATAIESFKIGPEPGQMMEPLLQAHGELVARLQQAFEARESATDRREWSNAAIYEAHCETLLAAIVILHNVIREAVLASQ